MRITLATTRRAVLLVAAVLLLDAVPARGQEVSFMEDIAPILTQRCAGCHGDKKTKGGYQLHTFAFLMEAGASDEAPVVAGKPDASELFRRVTEKQAARRMPPGDEGLTAAEIKLIRDWILSGAKFDGKSTTATLQSILPPRKHPDAPKAYRVPVPVFAVALAPDGKEMATGGFHEVNVWETATGRLLRRLPKLPQRIHALKYHPDGTRLLIGGGTPGEYGELTLVDARKGTKLRTFGTFEDVVLGVALSPDGTQVVAGAADRWVRAYQLADGKLRWQTQLHADWVTAVGFSADGSYVATGSKDRTIKILAASTGELFTTYNGHRQQFGPYKGQFTVFDLAFAEGGLQAFSAGEGPVIRVWNPLKVKEESGTARDMEQRFARGGHTRFIVHQAERPVFKLAVRADQVFAAAGDGVVRQFAADSGKLVREYLGHTDWVFAVDYHPGSQRAVSAAHDGQVRVWDTTTGQCLTTFTAAPGYAP